MINVYNSKSRRNLLLKSKEYRCEICSNTGVHNGKPLRLQVDHINGEAHDDRIENLRFLCPNCHSQTETFTGRNARTKNFNMPSKEEFLELLKQYTLKEISIMRAVTLRTTYQWYDKFVIKGIAKTRKEPNISCEIVRLLRASNKSTRDLSIEYQINEDYTRRLRSGRKRANC